jgi:hypothetical protein
MQGCAGVAAGRAWARCSNIWLIFVWFARCEMGRWWNEDADGRLVRDERSLAASQLFCR